MSSVLRIHADMIETSAPSIVTTQDPAYDFPVFLGNHAGRRISSKETLDSFAGTVKRAPKWMIAANLEWLYRLYKEPKRFGRMLRLPKYLWAVVCKRIRG